LKRAETVKLELSAAVFSALSILSNFGMKSIAAVVLALLAVLLIKVFVKDFCDLCRRCFNALHLLVALGLLISSFERLRSLVGLEPAAGLAMIVYAVARTLRNISRDEELYTIVALIAGIIAVVSVQISAPSTYSALSGFIEPMVFGASLILFEFEQGGGIRGAVMQILLGVLIFLNPINGLICSIISLKFAADSAKIQRIRF